MTMKNPATDNKTIIKAIAQEVLTRFNGAVDTSDEAARAMETILERFAHNFSATRTRILSPQERELLIAAIAEFRANETPEERGSVDRGGSDSLDHLIDDDLLEEFFIVNPAYDVVLHTDRYDGLTGAGYKAECMMLLQMVLKPGMLEHIDSLAGPEYDDWSYVVDDMVHAYVGKIQNSHVTLASFKQEAQELGLKVIDRLHTMSAQKANKNDDGGDAPAP